ncbi:MAG: hypothetical protein JXR48_09835 [Candidatus Delongbacteria bacterium]|nr:hypothetical protein [Candidatus Delongbacteria bacterium]MBN2835254.1 hypothetical protein [Candidatus Delongbacteria bacterium]
MKKLNFLLLILIVSFFVSCGSNDNKGPKFETKESGSSVQTEMAASGPVSVKKYETAEGADPSITAEMGGAGFEDVAESMGFVTNNTFEAPGDPNAKKGGEFTFSLTEYPATLRTEGKDSNSSVISMIGGFIYEGLVSMDPKTLEFTPALASHWKIEDDKQTFWFRIDPNARWSDGKPVVADDILSTWKLHMDEGILSPYDTQLYGKYEEPEIVSKYIVKVKAKELNWRLFLYFGASMSIYPSHHLKKIDGKGYLEKYQWNMLPGTGPYVLDDANTVKGQKISIRRRSDYWAENSRGNIGANNFDLINIVIIRDEVLEKEKFKKGDIDFYNIGRAQWWVNEFNIENPEPPFEELTRGLVQKVKVFNKKAQGISGLAFNMRKAPFDDIKIRKAFAMLWNIDQLIETLFFKEYKRITSGYPGSIYANEDNFVTYYNPEEANKLLDEAGWKNRNEEGYRINGNGEILELDFMIDQGRERIFTPYQEDLKKSGIKLNLKIADYNSISSAMNERRFKLLNVSWGGLFFPNPESSLHSNTADPDNTTNITGFKNARVDEICEEYNVCFDAAQRVKLLKEVDKIVSETVHYAYGWYSPYTMRAAYWNKFGMPASVISYTGDWNSLLSLWWYDQEKAETVKKGREDKSITMPIGPTEIDFWNLNN